MYTVKIIHHRDPSDITHTAKFFYVPVLPRIIMIVVIIITTMIMMMLTNRAACQALF